MPMIEHTGETIDDESSISQKLLDYGWAIPAAVGTAYVAKKGYDLYQGLKGRSIGSAPQPSASQMDQAIDVPSREVPKGNAKTSFAQQFETTYGVPLAEAEKLTGGPITNAKDAAIVGGALKNQSGISLNTPSQTTSYTIPRNEWLESGIVRNEPEIPRAIDPNKIGQPLVDPLSGKGFQQPPQSIGPVQAPIAPTPSVQAGVESGNPAKAVQSVIAKEIDKTASMYRNAEGKMVYPEGMSPAARSGYEAFTKQYPDIAKTLETKGQFGILGAGSGDNSLKNTYDFELAKKIRNEILGGKMVGPHGGEGGFYNTTVTPAIKAIAPTTELGKEIAALPEKGGTHGNLGTPATIGGAKGGLLTGANTVLKGLKAGGPAILLMAMADAAKAAESKESMSRASNAIKDIGIAPEAILRGKGDELGRMGNAYVTAGNPNYLRQLQAQLDVETNPERRNVLLREFQKIGGSGAGRGIAPPSAYMR